MTKKILFLYLNAFSVTGGIEKFNKAFLKALRDISEEGTIKYNTLSAYDNEADQRYVNDDNYKGYEGRRISFAFKSVKDAFKADTVVLGHINLAPIGLMIKLLIPRIKLILIAHGVEVWEKLPFLKNLFIKKTDLIFAVSSFTKNKIIEEQKIAEEKIKILYNTIDPFFKIPEKLEKPEYLLKRYNLARETKILLTVGRISGKEGNKGYDKVINILPQVLNQHSSLVYILAGKYDENEKRRVMNLVDEKKLNDHFMLTGYIEDEELTDHYLLANIFVMPSTQEGFGIVFLEALACGLPVIAGNKDGSVDALMNAKIGKLVDPKNSQELSDAIIDLLNIPKFDYKDLVLENFGFDQFKKRLRTMLIEN
jgi:phosphatidyl-myo-inositol dimannoside synthase